MFNFRIWKICGFHLNLWSYQFWLVVWVENLLDACSAIQCAQHIITTLNNNDEQATVGNSYREPWSRNGANERNCFALDIFAFHSRLFFVIFFLFYTHTSFAPYFERISKGVFFHFFVFFFIDFIAILYLYNLPSLWVRCSRSTPSIFIHRPYAGMSICLKIRLI